MTIVGKHGCSKNTCRRVERVKRVERTGLSSVNQVRGPLTEENVMEYFEESFIFDRSSNNNVLRMQTQHADPNVRMSRLETEAELKSVTQSIRA